MLTLPHATPVTKADNVPWLSNLPSNWSVVRSLALFSVGTERARADDEHLSATQAYGVIPLAEYERLEGRQIVKTLLHEERRRHVEVGDFVISMRSFQGGLERVWQRGSVRSSYVVLHPSSRVHVGFFAHLFKSQPFIQALRATANFIRDGQDLSISNFKLVDLPLVPLGEQARIAHYLDRKTAAIDALIEKKQKLVELLAEKRAALINQAVTKGLDPNVPMKDSGSPWIGDIPTDWSVSRLGYLAAIGNGSTPDRSNLDYWESGDIPWLNSSKVNDGIITSADQFVTREAIRRCHLPIAPAGAVVIGLTGEGQTRGRCALLELETTLSQHLAYVSIISNRLLPHFLWRQLCAYYSWLRWESSGVGSTKAAITCEQLKGVPIILPSLADQRAILNRRELTEGVLTAV